MKAEEDNLFSPVMEIECDQCKKPVLIVQLTPSVLNFNVTCHRCGSKMEGENFSHRRSARIMDENLKRWQNKNA